MKRTCLLVLLTPFLAGCSGVPAVEDPGNIAENLLQEFAPTEEAALLQYYADEIAECEKLNAAYSVYAAKYDLNQDGSTETISYLMSTLNSGSSGNLMLYVHAEDRVLPFSDEIYLNPHPDDKRLIPKLQVMESQSGGYHDIRYTASEASGAVVKELYFRFDGIGYIS